MASAARVVVTGLRSWVPVAVEDPDVGDRRRPGRRAAAQPVERLPAPVGPAEVIAEPRRSSPSVHRARRGAGTAALQEGGEGPQQRPLGTIHADRSTRWHTGRPSPELILDPGQLSVKPMNAENTLRYASGSERHGYHCDACGRFVVTAIDGLFRNRPTGSPARFCGPACRQAAYRRRRARTPENAPLQRSGGRRRRLTPPTNEPNTCSTEEDP